MTEGVIHKWLKKVGDSIKAGDMLAEIETDKATMEIEAYEDGKLLYIGVQEGEAALVNSVIAVIGEEGADFETLIKNPETAIRIIYQFIGESLSETSLEKMLNWDRTNVQHHHGRHDYSLADYNFDEKQLLDQFADYVEFVSALIPPDGSA
jgi:pyruvate/2-oxoglutarate dehydrogenase complex dihydrolipoamide acyltransferase (E2) component